MGRGAEQIKWPIHLEVNCVPCLSGMLKRMIFPQYTALCLASSGCSSS